MNLSASTTSPAHEQGTVDAMNNPTPQRFRKSVAFQSKKTVKVKLRIGSQVEVFSVSKNKWIDGKLTGIKKNLIRVAYGKGFSTEKWLRANSKQFRPKLDMLDDATNQKAKNGHYSIDNDEDSKVGTFVPSQPPSPDSPP